MHGIDFLSAEPKCFIFNKNSNKTNFGGILSLIYFIIVIIIAASYFIIYYLEDNYSIQYLNYINDKKPYDIYNNDKYNPKITFNNIISNSIGQIIGERIIIFDPGDGGDETFIPINGITERKITEVNWYILYDCLGLNETNCKIDESLFPSEEIMLSNSFRGYEFTHQDKSSPFHIQDEDNYYNYTYIFSFKRPKHFTTEWSLVKYKEDKGILSIFDKIDKNNDDEGKYIGIIPKSHYYYTIKTNDYYYVYLINILLSYYIVFNLNDESILIN